MPSQKLPTIGIDCRFAGTHSGIGRYTRELTRALLGRQDAWNYVFFIPKQSNASLELWKSEIRNSKFEVRFVELSSTHYSLREQLFLPRVIEESGGHLFHSPHFNVPFRCPIPFIATIHDLILHKFPNEASLPKHLAYRFLMRSTVQRAAHLIAVSNATALDLATTYGESVRKKLSVIHEGISAAFKPQSTEEQQRVLAKYLPANQQTSKPFILYVGATKEHKNVQMLIDACPMTYTLVFVTGGKEVSRLRLQENVQILPKVPDEDLPALYSAASAYVSPSLAEGFNFPVLEALACGCPVIATNRGATPEIAEKHAILIEPTLQALSHALKNIPPLPNEEARAHARGFTWEKVAEETARMYADVLKRVVSP